MNDLQKAERQMKNLITRLEKKAPRQVEGFTEAATYLIECFRKRTKLSSDSIVEKTLDVSPRLPSANF